MPPRPARPDRFRSLLPLIVSALAAFGPAVYALYRPIPTITGTQLVMLNSYNLIPLDQLRYGALAVSLLGLAALAAARLIRPKGFLTSYLPMTTLVVLWLEFSDIAILAVARHKLDSPYGWPLVAIPLWMLLWLIAGRRRRRES